MAKTCKIVYLDKHGNPSTVYEQNLHLGQDVAEKAYLESMQEQATMKFSVDPNKISGNWDNFIDFSRNKIIAAGDSDFYDVNGTSTKRVSGILNELHDEFNVNTIASQMAFNREVSKLRKTMSEDEASAALQDKYKVISIHTGGFSGNKAFDELVELVKEEFKFKQEAGTEIHFVLENFINLRNEHKGDKEYDTRRLARLATAHIDNTTVQKSHMDLIMQVNSLLKNTFYGHDLDKFQFETEVPVWDEELGVAGTIDLLVRDENGTVHIFDYKTKEKGKLQYWNATNHGILNIPGVTLHDNKSNMAALQTSLYKEILQRKGFKVASPKVIYVDAIMDAKDKTKPNTADNLQYKNFGKPRIMNVPDTRKAWVNIGNKTNLFGKTVDIDKAFQYEKEVGKLNNVMDIIDEITEGKALISTINYDRLAKRIIRESIITNTRTGREGFKTPSGTIADFKTSTEPERKKEIIDIFKTHFEEKVETVNHVFNIFNDINTRASDLVKSQIANALLGINKETHDLQSMNSLPGLSDMEDTFLVATHKATGVKQVIIVDNQYNNHIHFDNTSGDRTTIVGKYLRDSVAERKYGVEQNLMEATSGNFKILMAGMAMMRLKDIDPSLQVDKIRFAEILTVNAVDKTHDPVSIGMQSIIPQVVAILDQIRDKDGLSSLNDGLAKVYDNPELTNALAYNEDYLSTLYDMMNKTSELGNVDSYKRSIRDYQDSAIAREDLIHELFRYQRNLKKALTLTVNINKRVKDRAELALNNEYMILSKAILQLSNVDFYLGLNPEKLLADKDVRTYSRIKHSMVQELHSKRANAEAAAVSEFLEYKKGHNKLLEAFLKENNTSMIGAAGKRSYLSVYRVLYKNPTDDNSSPETIMKLKSADDLRAENKPAAAKYVEFFNKQIQHGFSLSMTKKRFESFTENKSWEEGKIPILPESPHSELSSITNPKEYLKVMQKRFMEGGKKQNKSSEDIQDYIDGSIRKQASETNWYTRLGVTEEGEVLRPDLKFEKNIEAVLDSFMIDNLRQKHMNGVLGIFRSMNAVLAGAEVYDKFKTKEARIFLDRMVQGQIHGEMDDDGTLGKWVDVLNNVATYTQIGYSAKQAVVELTTNLVGSTNTMISQGLTTLFGGKARFNAKDWAEAGAVLVGKDMGLALKVAPILHNLGMITGDIEQLYSDDFKKTQGNVLFTSKWAFWINSAAIREFRNQVFVAEAMKDGVINAYTYDKDKDDSIYDQYKDKRFFNSDGSQSDSQLALWKGNVKVSQDEGTLGENGELTRPYGFAEMQSKRDYYKDIFGSMSKEGKTNAQLGAFGRLFLKFKHWAQAKKDFYYTPTLKSKTRMDWVKMPDPLNPGKFIMDFQGVQHEGVWQTLVAIKDNLHAMVGRDGYEKIPLNNAQIENVAKATTDVLVASVLISVLSGLLDDDDFFKTELGIMVKKGLIMGLKDAQIGFLLQDMSQMSMMATPSMLINNVNRSLDCVGMFATGETRAGIEKTMGFTAATRGGLAAYKYAFSDEAE